MGYTHTVLWGASVVLLVACGGTERSSGTSQEGPDWIGRCQADADCEYEGARCESGTCRAPRPDPSDPCSVSMPSTSEEALAAVRACPLGIADDADLVMLRSNANGAMGATGRSLTWAMLFVSPGAATLVGVNDAVTVENTREETPPCSGAVEPLASSVVVPDAVARVGERAAYDHVNVFLFQEDLECEPEPVAPHVMVLGARFDEPIEGSRWWFVYYDDRTFRTLCGPCASNRPRQCTECTP